MNFYVNTDTQQLIVAPKTNQPIGPVNIPRAPNVTLGVQFFSGNVQYDPELIVANVVSASVATNSVITTAQPHGFSNGDTITLSGVSGTPKFILTSSIATATVINALNHGITSGDTVTIAGHVGSVPDINGTFIATVTDANNFTIPVTVTQGGTGGTVADANSTPTVNGSFTITYISATTFSVPVNVTSPGIGGTATKTISLALRFSAKNQNNFNQTPGSAYIPPGGFVKSGVGANAMWTGSLNLITTALNNVLGIDPTDTLPGNPQAPLMAEFSWTGVNPSKTQIFPFIVMNDVYKSGDGTPVTTGGQEGKQAIASGQNSVTVTFGTPMASALWHFAGGPNLSNVVDSPPSGIFIAGITARSTTGFTVALSAATDTSNFVLEYVIAPD